MRAAESAPRSRSRRALFFSIDINALADHDRTIEKILRIRVRAIFRTSRSLCLTPVRHQRSSGYGSLERKTPAWIWVAQRACLEGRPWKTRVGTYRQRLREIMRALRAPLTILQANPAVRHRRHRRPRRAGCSRPRGSSGERTGSDASATRAPKPPAASSRELDLRGHTCPARDRPSERRAQLIVTAIARELTGFLWAALTQ
jgi:hypothetical protein